MTARCLERSCPVRFRDGLDRPCPLHADAPSPRPAPFLPELAPSPRPDLERLIAEAFR